jgi:hypothetical protein
MTAGLNSVLFDNYPSASRVTAASPPILAADFASISKTITAIAVAMIA